MNDPFHFNFLNDTVDHLDNFDSATLINYNLHNWGPQTCTEAVLKVTVDRVQLNRYTLHGIAHLKCKDLSDIPRKLAEGGGSPPKCGNKHMNSNRCINRIKK